MRETGVVTRRWIAFMLVVAVCLIGVPSAQAAPTTVGPLSKFVISQPALVGAGQSFTVKIRAEDALGNTITGYNGTPTWFDVSGQLTGSPAPFVGGVSVNTVSLPSPYHADSIVVIDFSADVGDQSGAFSIYGPVTHFGVAVPTLVGAGQRFTVKVSALDALGDPVGNYNGPPTWSDTSGQLTGSPAGFSAGVSVNPITLSNPYHADKITVSDSSAGASGQSAAFSVYGPVTHFAVAAPTSVAAGQPFTVRVSALDALGDPVGNYSGPPTWSDTSGQLAGPLAAFAAGVSVSTVSLSNPYHADRITVSDSSAGASGQSAAIAVYGSLAGFSFQTPPSVSPGAPFKVVVTAEDALGSTVSSYAGSPTWSDTSGQLTGSPAAFSGGVSKSTVAIALPYAGDQITVTDGSVSSQSSPFTVTQCGPIAGGKTRCIWLYTGSAASWTVPRGVTGATFDVFGAQGGDGTASGGPGGETTAALPLTPEAKLQIMVGGSGNSGGWNGGGAGGSGAGNGGGASDVRSGACAATLSCGFATRLVVAGGGGGGTATFSPQQNYTLAYDGGVGGGANGGDGRAYANGAFSDGAPYSGGGASQTSGGAGGSSDCAWGSNGTLGQGGAGPNGDTSCGPGGGGGGGYYGGGGGAGGQPFGYGGGGGSGYAPGTRGVFQSGVQAGNGEVVITYPVTPVAPSITSAATTQFPTAQASSFTVTTDASAWPVPHLSETGQLPVGVTFTNNGDGTATLAGTPAADQAGQYPITITASNGVSPNATQSFVLNVGTAAQITSSNSADFSADTGGSVTITTSGDPAVSAITESGALPPGLTFTDNGNGTATISGTPTDQNEPVIGNYPITLTTTQAGTWTAATQSFNLEVVAAYSGFGLVPFNIYAHGTDGAVLNPGFGVAIQGYGACTPVFADYYPYFTSSCSPATLDEAVGGGRACAMSFPEDSAPYVPTDWVSPLGIPFADCWAREIDYDPLTVVTVSTPAETTVGTTTYVFLYWASSMTDGYGNPVYCQEGTLSDLTCTFPVPPAGVNITAMYLPLPSGTPSASVRRLVAAARARASVTRRIARPLDRRADHAAEHSRPRVRRPRGGWRFGAS